MEKGYLLPEQLNKIQGRRNRYFISITEPFLHVSNHEYYGDNFISKP